MLKIVSAAGGWLLVLLFLSGCTPPGPRALLKGKQRLESGRYSDATVQLETATSLMGTNAQAWNYLGLAYHYSGRAEDAAKAYLRALTLDRTLAEARYNLGCLYLEHNKLEAAKSALTAYTLERENAPEGYLRLGAVLTTTGDLAGAENAFQHALRFSTNCPEALTGLGVIRQKKGRGTEAAQFFAAALKQDPHYGPALLNYGIVAQEVLRDRILAIQHYRQYLALKPTPPQAEAISDVLRRLEETSGAMVSATAPRRKGEAAPSARPPDEERTPAVVIGKPAPAPAAQNLPPETSTQVVVSAPDRSKAAQVNTRTEEPKPAEKQISKSIVAEKQVSVPTARQERPPEKTGTVEVVKLSTEPTLRVARDTKTPQVKSKPSVPASSAPAPSEEQPEPPRRGFFHAINPLNLFGGKGDVPSASPANGKDESPVSQAGSPYAAKYNYSSPSKPAPGNSAEAEQVFLQGVKAYRERHLKEAIDAFQRAAQLDPAFYGAHFNLGLTSADAGKLEAAARAYEVALAIRPDSRDARYNLALLLKQMGYPVDCAAQLERLLIYYPRDARAHVTLGNVYAQQFKNVKQAREHYLKALEADPKNPQAEEMRYWLTDHPK